MTSLSRLRDLTESPTQNPILGNPMQAADFARILWYIAPDAIVVSDQQGVIFMVNPQAEFFLGYRSGDLIGHRVDLFLSSESQVLYARYIQTCVDAPNIGPVDTMLRLSVRRSDGIERQAELRAIPITMPERTVIITMLKDASHAELSSG